MIVGAVTTRLEPRVGIKIRNATGKSVTVTATVDTGFNGFLSLNQKAVEFLELAYMSQRPGTLADNSSHEFDVFEAEVDWDGDQRWIEVDSLEGEPLIGTQLLRRYELRIQMYPGGGVWITPPP